MASLRLSLIALVAAVQVVGCMSQPDGHHPRSALDKYVRAVRANDPRAAYGLLSKEVQAQVSLEEFTRRWQASHDDLKAQAAELERARSKPKAYNLQATFTIGTQRSVSLALEGERWRILGGVGSGLDSASPREAVVALVRALESKNFSAFLKLLSKPRQEQFQREMSLRLEKLRANLDRDFEVLGNRARLQYDPRFWIQLVKEKGVWKIVEFN
ncbi:MAG: hypothetical protein RBU30_01695 [Polyangia bacterium]|jgi:hypothetical protein|nr:hypothetical protein [Polyangia bacterium]